MTHDKLPSDTIPSNDPNFQLTKGNHPIVSLSAALKIVALLIIASGALFLASHGGIGIYYPFFMLSILFNFMFGKYSCG